MACGDPKAAARVAILDPLLTVSQPPRVTACTGIDALAHALETAVTKKRSPLSAMFSREAFRLCFAGLERVLRCADDVEARGLMLLGAALAGTAIENSMLGAAHAAANPLTAKFGLVHGQAVGVMLPAVIAFNAADEVVKALYLEHAAVAGMSSIEELIARVEELLSLAGMRDSLNFNGALAPALPELAASAAKQWTASFNPRPIAAPDFERLYEEVLA
jgi:alcohol dehydrogenase